MEGPLLRGMADGRAYRADELEEVLAEGTDVAGRDLATPAKSALTTDMRGEIGRATTLLKQAGLVSYPDRGLVRITEKGLAKISRDIGRLDMQDGGAPGGAPAGGAKRPAFVNTGEIVTAGSPPLSPGEIAIFDAIASGAEKPYRVSKSELLRNVTDYEKTETDVE